MNSAPRTNPIEMSGAAHTEGPWEYIASTEHHGPYVVAPYGGDICDCYAMSNPSSLSVRNGGNSKHIPFQGEQADANAAFIVRAVNSHDELVEALRSVQKLISEGAMVGFNPKDGDWADRLFQSQQVTSRVLKAATPSPLPTSRDGGEKS